MNHIKVGENLEPQGSPWPSSVETLTAARVLTDEDNGKTFILGGNGQAITLPDAKAGLRFKFITGVAFTGTWVIGNSAGDSNNIQGVLLVNGASVDAANEDAINFVGTADTIGDHAELVSDGTSWFVSGVGSSAGSITATT